MQSNLTFLYMFDGDRKSFESVEKVMFLMILSEYHFKYLFDFVLKNKSWI
jgi:hypothetical protein